MSQELTLITLISCLFSVLSIITSSFEYSSSSRLLRTTRVLALKIGMYAPELSRMRRHKFKKIENLRNPIVWEFSKMVSIDPDMIELMKPTQTKVGLYLIFRITFNAQMRDQLSNIGSTLQVYAHNGQMVKV